MLAAARAQEIEPRAYANAPVGTNFLIGGYAYTQGAVPFDAALPIKNAHLSTSSAVLAYARVLDLGGISGKLAATLPYTALSGTAELSGAPVERNVDGLADAILRLSANLYGSPALSAQEFRSYQQDLIVGTSLTVSAPTGQYDPSRVVNIGSNRWAVKPELGMSQALGAWTFELKTGATFFGDNTNFNGGKTRSQETLYSVQGHVIHSFNGGIWGSLDATWFAGGRTTVDAARNQDLQQNWRVGATLALPVDAASSIKLYASSGVSARTGNNFDLLGIAWQYRWGAGL